MNDVRDYRVEPSTDPLRPGHVLTLDYAPETHKAARKHGIPLMKSLHVPASMTELPANVRISVPGEAALYLVLENKPKLTAALAACISARAPAQTATRAPAGAPGYL